MELDPHQLIEGCLIACYAVGPVAVLPLHPRRDGRRPGAGGDGAERGVRRRLRRQEHPRHRLLRRHRDGVGRRRLHRRRGDGAHREPRGQPRDAAAEAAVLPRGHRPVRPADDRQQRRDAVQPAVAAGQRRRGVHGDRHRDVAGHAHGRRVRARAAAGRVRDRQRHDDVPRPALRRGVLPGHPRRQRAEGVRARRWLGAVVPSRPARPAVRGQARRRSRIDARFRGDHGDGRDHRHPVGRAHVAALLRPRVVRQVRAVPRGWHVAGAHPRSASSTVTARPRTSTCCCRSASRSARARCRTPPANGSISTPCRSRTR